MPPSPRSEMLRSRLARRVPGRKRPLLEGDERDEGACDIAAVSMLSGSADIFKNMSHRLTQMSPDSQLESRLDGAGRRENVLGGAVVLLQADGFGLGVVAFEVQNVPDVGAAPAIDRLVFVAHHADIAMLFRQQTHEVVLGAVGVLVL